MSNYTACDVCDRTNQHDLGTHFNFIILNFDTWKKHAQANTFGLEDDQLEFHLCRDCLKVFKEQINKFLGGK